MRRCERLLWAGIVVVWLLMLLLMLLGTGRGVMGAIVSRPRGTVRLSRSRTGLSLPLPRSRSRLTPIVGLLGTESTRLRTSYRIALLLRTWPWSGAIGRRRRITLLVGTRWLRLILVVLLRWRAIRLLILLLGRALRRSLTRVCVSRMSTVAVVRIWVRRVPSASGWLSRVVTGRRRLRLASRREALRLQSIASALHRHRWDSTDRPHLVVRGPSGGVSGSWVLLRLIVVRLSRRWTDGQRGRGTCRRNVWLGREPAHGRSRVHRLLARRSSW